MGDLPPGLGAAELTAWLRQATVDEAAAARRREHWLRVQAEESATLAAVLLDAAERDLVVRVRAGGRGWESGRVSGVGVDFFVMDGPAGAALVAVAAIEALDLGDRPAPADDRVAPLGVDLVEALALLLADRPELAVWTNAGGEPVRGELRSVGGDLVSLRDGRRTVVVPSAAITRVRVLG